MIRKIKQTFFVGISSALVFPILVSAKGLSYDETYGIGKNNPGSGSNVTLIEIIAKIITFLLGFVGALAVLGIIVSGIWYITSGGDEGRVETAKKWLIFSVIGLVVALLGWVIVNTVITGLEGK